MKNHLKQVKHVFEKYERFMLPLMLLFGVTTDYIAFKAIDTNVAFIWLGFHLLLAPSVIAYINWYDGRGFSLMPTKRALQYARVAAPLLMQLSFGALLNASFVFYWFSASFSVSWPFFVIVVLLMISNDVFRHYYLEPVVQIGVYFFACFSILALMVPYLANSIEPQWFVGAGTAAIVLTMVFVGILSGLTPSVQKQQWKLAAIGLGIFVIMNALYFFNLIPPIPLSLREAEVVHSVTRKVDGYHLLMEQQTVWDKWNPISTIHITDGEQVFVYSSIFAPTDLETDIFHRWQWFDPEQQKWIDESRYGFTISGGRQEGYRGYSLKTRVKAGKWRVQVETPRGQVLGRVRFNVQIVSEAPVLVEEVR